MAGYNHDEIVSLKAASAIAAYVPVSFLPGASALDETVQRAGSSNEFAFGFTIATIATYGMPVPVAVNGRVKAVAGASIGAGAPLAIGSTNGILVPIAANGLPAIATQSIAVATDVATTYIIVGSAAVPARYQVARALKNAAAGDIFDVYVDVKQIV